MEVLRGNEPGAEGLRLAELDRAPERQAGAKVEAAVLRSPDPLFRAFVPLLLLTGLRKNELLQARWDQIDLKRGEIRLPKTKSGRPQIRKLSGPAVEILRFLPREGSNPHVFPGRKPGTHRRDFRNEWLEVRERAGLADVTLHDLRRTLGSWQAATGASLPIICKTLGHRSASTTQISAAS